MTASDHLKHRIGSRITQTQIEQISENGWWASCPIDSSLARDLARDLKDALAALAQKTRECEELRSARNDSEQHFAEEFRKNQSLEAQVEQLGRQVASLSKS